MKFLIEKWRCYPRKNYFKQLVEASGTKKQQKQQRLHIRAHAYTDLINWYIRLTIFWLEIKIEEICDDSIYSSYPPPHPDEQYNLNFLDSPYFLLF